MNINLEPIRNELEGRRWFGSKGRAIRAVELMDSCIVEDGPPAFVLAIITVSFEEGPEDIYQLPLLVEENGESRDAFDEADRLRILGELMAHGSSLKGENGVFQFGGPGLDPSNPPGSWGARALGAEQSNTSLVLDEAIILKTFRRVAIGDNPDLELTRLLTTEGFVNIPAHSGEICYDAETEEGEVHIDLALAQSFVSDAHEGWSEALQRIRELYEAVDPQDVNEDIPFLIEERGHAFLEAIEDLGEATASLHVTLAREQADPDLAPETTESFDLQEWSTAALARLNTLTTCELPGLNEMVPQVTERLKRVVDIEHAGLKTRVHGDFHLGQVIRSPKGWLILDFEGEPARTLEERRAKNSPLKDVAGMLRSFSYAASASLFEKTGGDDKEQARLEPWALTWERLARERFLHGYLTRSHEGDFLPRDRDSLLALLDFFEIDKALYELDYELGHRPDWIHIPLRGIRQVIERGETR